LIAGTITLQFRGIHPTSCGKRHMGEKIQQYHYITVPGHPSDEEMMIYSYDSVPLHYSSGASIRQKYSIHELEIKVPLHYSSGASIRRYLGVLWEKQYHYITVPGHPSDNADAEDAIFYGGTITLQFRGIHPTKKI